MGKRKFKKPDDSESDYEWEEAAPKKPTKQEIGNSKDNDLEGFLNQYSTKSRSDVRCEKTQLEKEQQDKLYEERIYKPAKVETQNFVTQWLKKAYYRCKEQATNEGVDIMTLLKDRYDDKNIEFMMRKFGNNGSDRSYSNKYHGSKSYSSSHKKDLTESYSREISKNPFDRGNVDSNQVVEERYVTDTDINEACANLLRAEVSGNSSKISKLKKKVETLREAQKRNLKIRLTQWKKTEDKEDVMILKSLKSGKMIPYIESANKFISQSRPYDSVNSGLKDLIREEQAIDGDENDLAFAKMSGKTQFGVKTVDEIGDCEYNDTFVHKKVNTGKMLQDEKQKVISMQKRRTAQVGNCKLCYDKFPKHLVLSKGCYFCLIVPMNLGITEFHLQLMPLDHIAASSHLNDDDSWTELCQFKRRIVEFFDKELKSETIFMETVINLKNYPHAVIDCIPLTRERDNFHLSTSIFFKKSIDEAKSEWCQNKKLLDLKDGDVRRTVPKEFPYFSVQFDDIITGYVFIIENEHQFSSNFGLEIVGSLLDKNLIEINNRKVKTFNEQADVVLKYEKKWKRYNLWQNDDSDSD